MRAAGFPLHVIQRGNNRSACFADDADRQLFLQLLGILASKFQCALHAYVLMTNHVHLLITPETADGGSIMMKQLGVRYVQHFNRAHGRTGTLWEGRFRSSVVATEGYFLCCQRYIEANPVRAGMVSHPAEYRWSSHRFNAWGEPDALVTPHPVYLALGSDAAQRQEVYRGLSGSALDPKAVESIRVATNSGQMLGADRVIHRVRPQLSRR
jgi:putative transposase